MQSILIVGGGFAGVWSALESARTLRQLGRDASVRVTLVSRDSYLTIRPRLYEADPDGLRVPLDAVLARSGVERIEAEVTAIDTNARVVIANSVSGPRALSYDQLILASGSALHRPNASGFAEHTFSVDTYDDAVALDRHVKSLPGRPDRSGRFTAVVVGAGFTGLEVGTELIGRLRALASDAGAMDDARVVLVEQKDVVGPDIGPNPRPVIETALRELGVELRLATGVAAVHADHVMLSAGEKISAATTVWTAGLRASALTAQLPVERDALGRVTVDEFLRVQDVASVFAAGDVARAMADSEHVAPMSCQHAIPMGERAGRNAVAALLGVPLVAFSEPHYVTCLDLGAWGALFTQGWNRDVKLTGYWAKMMKQTINTRMIYPPISSDQPHVVRTSDRATARAA